MHYHCSLEHVGVCGVSSLPFPKTGQSSHCGQSLPRGQVYSQLQMWWNILLGEYFTPEQRADLIFTKGHVDLICNIEQYHINKTRLELHPRMRNVLQTTELEDLSTDEDKLVN